MLSDVLALHTLTGVLQVWGSAAGLQGPCPEVATSSVHWSLHGVACRFLTNPSQMLAGARWYCYPEAVQFKNRSKPAPEAAERLQQLQVCVHRNTL